MSHEIKWLPEPELHDYPAAESYLALHFEDVYVTSIGAKLRNAPVTRFKAKDIFRASGLPLLGISNTHVEKNREKIKDGKELSPLLLVRSRIGLLVADGYHRLCTVYGYDEDAWIPCKIV